MARPACVPFVLMSPAHYFMKIAVPRLSVFPRGGLCSNGSRVLISAQTEKLATTKEKQLSGSASDFAGAELLPVLPLATHNEVDWGTMERKHGREQIK
jgi:hypothetical protein